MKHTYEEQKFETEVLKMFIINETLRKEIGTMLKNSIKIFANILMKKSDG